MLEDSSTPYYKVQDLKVFVSPDQKLSLRTPKKTEINHAFFTKLTNKIKFGVHCGFVFCLMDVT